MIYVAEVEGRAVGTQAAKKTPGPSLVVWFFPVPN
jgi:hypothetical protein